MWALCVCVCVCVYIHTVELFSALKRNTDRCRNMNKTITLENLTVSERSKTQKAMYNTIFFHLYEMSRISKCYNRNEPRKYYTK